MGIEKSLCIGRRGLPKGSSLGQLLREHRGACHELDATPLSIARILQWADSWRERHGNWPNSNSGPVPESPDDNWKAIDAALYYGHRYLPGGTTLARLLAHYRGKRNRGALPRVTEEQILAWADAYFAQHGKWPTQKSGPVAEAPGENWNGLNKLLVDGRRGLPGGSSLPRLLADRRGKRYRPALLPFSEEQILAWADAYHARYARWPTIESGAVIDAPGETWAAVSKALTEGHRGLPGGSSLAKLLDHCRRKVPELVACAAANGTAERSGAPLSNADDAHVTPTRSARASAAENRPVRIRPK